MATFASGQSGRPLLSRKSITASERPCEPAALIPLRAPSPAPSLLASRGCRSCRSLSPGFATAKTLLPAPVSGEYHSRLCRTPTPGLPAEREHLRRSGTFGRARSVRRCDVSAGVQQCRQCEGSRVSPARASPPSQRVAVVGSCRRHASASTACATVGSTLPDVALALCTFLQLHPDTRRHSLLPPIAIDSTRSLTRGTARLHVHARASRSLLRPPTAYRTRVYYYKAASIYRRSLPSSSTACAPLYMR